MSVQEAARQAALGGALLWLATLAVCGAPASGAGAVPSVAARLPPPEPDGARAFAHLEAQVACGPRLPGSPGSTCCRRYILDELRRRTPHVEVQAFVQPDPYGPDSLHLANLVAHFHVERRARVLLGAHYDTRPRADQEKGPGRDLPVSGANDGASGVAVLLEVARGLAAWDPGVGVDLVFFDGEDYGREGDLDHYFLGSRYFASHLGADRPRAMLLVDMVGDKDLEIPMEGLSLREAPALARQVFAVAESLQAPGFVARSGPPVYDDHVPFLQAGIPALDLIDFDYPAWHTLQDLPDRCSPRSLWTVARVLLNALPGLAPDSRPGFQPPALHPRRRP